IIRPSALGDVCRTVPVLASLRAAYPRATIDWLVQDTFAEAIVAHPALTSVVPFPRARFGWLARRLRLTEILRYLGELRRARYDLVIDCQGLARSGIFAWATRSARRVGYANSPEAAWLAYTDRVHADLSMHAVDRMLALVRAIGVPVTADMRLFAPARALEMIDRDPVLREPFMVVAPTSRWPGKRWPPERFVEVIHRVLDAMNGTGVGAGIGRVVMVGAASERPQCALITRLAASEPRLIDRVGATGVGELMALVARSSLVLGNDSAVLHMAVGFDRPIVGLYGPTHVSRVGPYGRERDVIRHVREGDRIDHKDDASGKALMDRIGVEEVAAAVIARLGSSARRPRAAGT
nr:glycosyltransferase family 9 protein [Phycisphaerales bacterium]